MRAPRPHSENLRRCATARFSHAHCSHHSTSAHNSRGDGRSRLVPPLSDPTRRSRRLCDIANRHAHHNTTSECQHGQRTRGACPHARFGRSVLDIYPCLSQRRGHRRGAQSSTLLHHHDPFSIRIFAGQKSRRHAEIVNTNARCPIAILCPRSSLRRTQALFAASGLFFRTVAVLLS